MAYVGLGYKDLLLICACT